MTLQTQRLQALEQIRAFVAGSEGLDFTTHERQAAYAFTAETLRRFGYTRLSRADKGVIVRYLCKVTGRSRQQVTRLIGQFRTTGEVRRRTRALSPAQTTARWSHPVRQGSRYGKGHYGKGHYGKGHYGKLRQGSGLAL